MSIRNSFYSGAYAQVLSRGVQPAQLPPDQALERQTLIFRSLLALGNTQAVITQIKDADPVELQVLKHLAQSQTTSTSNTLSALEKCVQVSGGVGHNLLVCCPVAGYYYSQGLLENALQLVSRGARDVRHLECLGLQIQIYLALHRPDLARQEIEIIKSKADDSALAQLLEAWVDLYTVRVCF